MFVNWKQVHEKSGFKQKQSGLKIPYTQINSKWTQHLREKAETISTLKENVYKKGQVSKTEHSFSHKLWIDFFKINNFSSSRLPLQLKRRDKPRQTPGRGLVPRTYKFHRYVNNKGRQPVREQGEDLNRHSRKKFHVKGG